MAPRTAKTKKSAEITDGAKKGRGKAKIIEETEPDVPETDSIEEAAPVIEKKNKRGKKANDANGLEQNGKIEETAPPAKKGRKKNVEEIIPSEKPESNDDHSGEDDTPVIEQDDADAESLTKETQSAPAGRGRKKQTKKETVADKVKPETKISRGRGKNAKQEIAENEEAEKEDVEDKPKSVGKGRGRKAQPKVEETESDDKIEDVKPEPPPTKGRKKQVKAAKEKNPESDPEEPEEDEDDKPLGESKKKDSKSRKNQGKKGQAKEVEDEDLTEEVPAPKKRKVGKKEDKGKGDIKDEETDEIPEPKPAAKGRRGQKKVEITPAESDDEPQDTGEVTTKRKRKAAEEKAPAEDVKKKAPPKNKTTTNYDEIDFSNNAQNAQGKDWNFKISSWNVDGIRAWMNKGGLEYIKSEKPDILCLQEIKCSQDKLPEDIANLPGYHAYWLCSEKDGYAGVGIYTTKLAMNVQYGLQNEELDTDGRIITAEYEQFYLICTYVPNAGRKLVTLPKRLQWNEEFRKYVKELDKKKPVIICGDMNVSHNEIDLANPKTNKRNAGFTEEERSGMTDLLGDGFVDTYRHLNPDKKGAYTFWTYMMNSRAKNVGWRLDYFIVSERLLRSICDNVIRTEVYGSDHCPISLFLHLSTADKPKE